MSRCLLFLTFFLIVYKVFPGEVTALERAKFTTLINSANDHENLIDGSQSGLIDPDARRDTLELISSRGFEAEEHKVITEDGYIVTLHRITNPFIPSNVANKRPVLCVHGLMDTSATFVMNSAGGFASPMINPPNKNDSSIPGNNLGFVLSNHGYDVWLGNPRGSPYNKNARVAGAKGDYWDFSFDEMAKYDVPAFINKIQTVTGSPHVGYIGHSQGSMFMLALLALTSQGGMKDTRYANVDYNQVVRPYIGMAPVTHLQWVRSPAVNLDMIPGAIKVLKLVKSAGWKQFPPSMATQFPSITRLVTNLFCRGPTDWFCHQLMFLGVGFDEDQINPNRMRVYASHGPTPTSMQNLIHFVQIYKTGNFSLMDYGPKGNVAKYGTKRNPLYRLDKISNKYIAIFSAENDWCADPKDVEYLKKSLSVKLFEDYVVPFKKWNHMDFVWGKEAGKYVNAKILEVLERANSD